MYFVYLNLTIVAFIPIIKKVVAFQTFWKGMLTGQRQLFYLLSENGNP